MNPPDLGLDLRPRFDAGRFWSRVRALRRVRHYLFFFHCRFVWELASALPVTVQAFALDAFKGPRVSLGRITRGLRRGD